MNLKPVNSINNDGNTIRVSDGNSPIRLIFKDAKGEVINLYDKIDYFYLTKDDEKFYSVTDISYDGDEVIIRLPKLRKGKYKAEIRDKDGSIYPANEDLYILLRRSFEDDKDIHYFGHREDILNNVEPMVIQHIEKNPNKFKGERGHQGFPGRDGLKGIDGKKGDKGDKGDKGEQGIQGIKGDKGDKGDPGKDGVITPEQYALINNKIDKGDVKKDDLSTELLSLINNSEGVPLEILSIPRDGSVSTKKTDFITESLNAFNPNKSTFGKTINESTGAISDNDLRSISDFIDVSDVESVYRNNLSAIALYDSNYKFLGKTPNATGSYTLSPNTSIIRVEILNSGLFDFYLSKHGKLAYYQEGGVETEIERTPKQLKLRNEEEMVNFESLSVDEFFYKNDEVINLFSESTFSTNNSIALKNEYVNRFKSREKSINAEMSTGTNRIGINLTKPIQLTGVSELISIIYLTDVSAINSVTISIPGTSFERKNDVELKNGWNVIRHITANGNLQTWDAAEVINLNLYTSKKTKVYISEVFVVKNEKAKIILVNDHGYSNFKTVAYPQLKERGIPVTWAINPGRLGTRITNVENILSQSEIDELSYDYMSEFSYHAWNPTEKATKNMNEKELLEEHHKCMTYLKRNGLLPKRTWRAAFTNNLAPAHRAIQYDLDGYASYNEAGGMEVTPFKNKYNINRINIHGVTNASMDGFFDRLKKTHCTIVFYTHGLDDAGGTHLKTSELNYFLQKIDDANIEGYLEGTTFSKIMAK